jgi:hypothetical protein
MSTVFGLDALMRKIPSANPQRPQPNLAFLAIRRPVLIGHFRVSNEAKLLGEPH